MDRSQLLNDPETAMRVALEGAQARLWTALPGIVESINWDAMTVEVQPAIMGSVTNPDGTSTYVKLPLLVDVPICFPSAGGFILTMPIKKGDEVLVILASRCIDAWWQSSGVGIPVEARMHDLSDGFALPGPRSKPKAVADISQTNAQLRSDTGAVYIEITPAGGINLKAPAGVKITGALEVTGNVTAAQVTAGGIALSTHKHLGVVSGSATSGGPTP